MAPLSHLESPESSPDLAQEINRLAALPEVRAASAWLRAQEAQFSRWQLEAARTPAPPFG
jgi:hypothetical protein